MTYDRDLLNRAARAGIILPGARNEVLEEIVRLRKLERETGVRVFNDEHPAYSGGGGVQIDTTPADYLPIGDAYTPGATGLAADAGTIWQHGTGLTPDGHDTREWTAKDFGFLAWTGDPWGISSGQAQTTAGTLQVIKLKVPRALPAVTSVNLMCQTAGVGLTALQCLAGLYDNSKNKIALTADQSANWNSTGFKPMALTGGPFAVPAGFCYLVLNVNLTPGTFPKFVGGGLQGAMVNFNIAPATARFYTADAGITNAASWPATLGVGSTASAQAYWGAIA